MRKSTCDNCIYEPACDFYGNKSAMNTCALFDAKGNYINKFSRSTPKRPPQNDDPDVYTEDELLDIDALT